MMNGRPISTVHTHMSLKMLSSPHEATCAPRKPAIQWAIPADAKKRPIMDACTRSGATLVMKDSATGDRQSSPIVWNR